MVVSNKQNVGLWKRLFVETSNYDMWAPRFVEEFVKNHMDLGRVPGVLSPSTVSVDDELDTEFAEWLSSVGIDMTESTGL